MESIGESRWNEILKLWNDYPVLFISVGFVFGLMSYPIIQIMSNNFSSFMYDLIPEFVGMMFTVLFIDRLYAIRDKKRQINELKSQLIKDVKSGSSEFAKRAIEEIRQRGWANGANSLLTGQNLTGANLEECNLQDINFSDTNLTDSNLHNTILDYANFSNSKINYTKFTPISCKGVNFYNADFRESMLRGIVLDGCNFHHSNLAHNNMQNTILYMCDFTDAFMRQVDLNGAKAIRCNFNKADFCEGDFTKADFRECSLLDTQISLFMDYDNDEIFSAKFNNGTILPDGTRWQKMEDLENFGASLNPIQYNNHWAFDKGEYFKITKS